MLGVQQGHKPVARTVSSRPIPQASIDSRNLFLVGCMSNTPFR